MISFWFRFLIIFVSIIFLQISYGFADDKKPLSLEECINIALKNHPSIRVSEKEVAAAGEQYKEAFSSYYPKASIDASYTRSEAKALTFITGQTEAYSTSLKLEQKVYDFGRTAGSVDAARFRIDEKGSDLAKTRQDIIFNVNNAYFSVLKARGLMNVQEAAVKQAEAHLRQARGFFEAGAKAKFDVTKAEVELNEANLNLIKAGNTLKTALASLKNRMGVDYNYVLEIEEATSKTGGTVELETGIKDALSRRPDIQGINASIMETEASLRASKGDYYPNLFANASYGYYDQFPLGSGNDLFREKNQRWNIGLSVNIPIFEGYLTRAKVSEIAANIERLKAQKEVASNDITLEVTQAYLEFQDAEARIGVAESGLNKAKENLDIANGRYEAGVGTLLEVTDAQAAHVKAETDLIEARYDTEIARARFEKAVGLP